MELKVPFCNYTYLDNLLQIIDLGGIRSRMWLEVNGHFYEDISIDPNQETRTELGLTDYVPLFVGYYSNYRSRKLNWYLMKEYDKPRLQNNRFYGALHKTIRMQHPEKYKNVVILIASYNKVCKLADEGRVLLYTDLAIKNDSDCLDSLSEKILLENIEKCIVENDRGGNELTCEIDILDDGNNCIDFPNDIDVIIVDNNRVVSQISQKINSVVDPRVRSIASNIPIFVDSLPNK